jgi:hypothetical protein
LIVSRRRFSVGASKKRSNNTKTGSTKGPARSEELSDFSQAAVALRQCSSDPKLTAALAEQLESNIAIAAREMLEAAGKEAYPVRLRRLEADFGRAALALMQCSSESGTVKTKLESDFGRAAAALRQCSSDTGPPDKSARHDLQRAAVALLETDGKNKEVLSDFNKVVSALAQCSMD